MANELAKVTVNWTGFNGAPGYTNFYFNDFSEGTIDQAIVDGAVNRADAFCGQIASRIPPTVRIQVDSNVQIIEATNGQLVGFMTGPAKNSRPGAAAGAYSAASGAVVNWYTNGVRNGRRIRGRTFIVPLGGAAMSGDGNIDDSQLSGLRAGMAALYAPGTDQGVLGVWARPTVAGATDGQWWPVTSHTVPDKAAILRSRRD